MSIRMHRFVVLVCALSWLLVGMHSPVLHEMIDHGTAPRWPLLLLLTLFVVVGVTSLWALLRPRAASAA